MNLNKLIVFFFGLFLSLAVAQSTFAQEKQKTETSKSKKECCVKSSKACKIDSKKADKIKMDGNHKCSEKCDHDKMGSKSEEHKNHMMESSSEGNTSEAKIFNEVCPVKGEKINPKVTTVKYKDMNIGFCCKGCDKKFKSDPESYMKNLSNDGKKFIKK